jgi:hypothetical protein
MKTATRIRSQKFPYIPLPSLERKAGVRTVPQLDQTVFIGPTQTGRCGTNRSNGTTIAAMSALDGTVASRCRNRHLELSRVNLRRQETRQLISLGRGSLSMQTHKNPPENLIFCRLSLAKRSFPRTPTTDERLPSNHRRLEFGCRANSYFFN